MEVARYCRCCRRPLIATIWAWWTVGLRCKRWSCLSVREDQADGDQDQSYNARDIKTITQAGAFEIFAHDGNDVVTVSVFNSANDLGDYIDGGAGMTPSVRPAPTTR